MKLNFWVFINFFNGFKNVVPFNLEPSSGQNLHLSNTLVDDQIPTELIPVKHQHIALSLQAQVQLHSD